MKLWESDHPYYASEGCYYHAGCHEDVESWTEFKENSGWYDDDLDLNLIYRWDWDEFNPENDDAVNARRPPILKLYYILQRKGSPFSVHVVVSRDDEPEIRAWLQPRLQRLMELWAPMVTP